LGSDGLPVLETGEWAREKHFYLGRYMSIFAAGMKAKWGQRIYIDLFAGPGICRLRGTDIEIPGSPLLALETKFGFTGYFLNDQDPAFVEALKRRASRYEGRQITFLNQECNSAVRSIASALPVNSLSLAFIDPFKWHITFDSLAALTRGRRMDLVITFHSGSIKRAVNSEPTALDEFFGSSTWKAEYAKSRRSGRREGTRILLDCYESTLEGIGYLHHRDYVLVKNSRGTPLYHLVLASKHPRGLEFWDKVSERDRDGQIRLL
jgi:three-Cys-motif partner protein